MEHLLETLKQLEEDNQSLGQSLVDQEQTKRDIEASIKIISSDFEKVRVLDRIDGLFETNIMARNRLYIIHRYSSSSLIIQASVLALEWEKVPAAQLIEERRFANFL